MSDEALVVAKANAKRNGVQIEWKKIDILSQKPNSVDIIVSNPPYICHKEKATMDSRVLDYEPHNALFVPDDNPFSAVHTPAPAHRFQASSATETDHLRKTAWYRSRRGWGNHRDSRWRWKNCGTVLRWYR